MKKHKNLSLLFSLMLFLGALVVLLVFYWDRGPRQNRIADILLLFLPIAIACSCSFLILRKSKILAKLLIAANALSFCMLLGFGCFYVLATNHTYSGHFSIETTLFDNRNILVVVPHQDDDVNLMGGLIEQYTRGNSEVSVVFTTNGDGDLANADIRAAEAVEALSAMGVNKENIYYLGYGDMWSPQMIDGAEIRHIYNSPDPNVLWTSAYGANVTYGTQSIPCYLDLPYTRNNYLFSMESIILEVMPDTIFAVDFDSHLEHKATDLFFEEALCNILKNNPDYHPTVYKGFCYGTAWKAEDDFYDTINPISTKKPDSWTWSTSSFGYTWENRLRFPESIANLNPLLLNNAVYHAFNDYGSQFAYIRAQAVLNGDKVFWERRTDSLLYDAVISVAGEPVSLLNDFKLKDFTNIFISPETASGSISLINRAIKVQLADKVAAGCIYLYDNPSEIHNIQEGYITFSDGTRIEFGPLNQNGSATVISFPDKQIEWFEIVPTKTEGDFAGLSEIELYHQVFDYQEEDFYLMAVDSSDNLVYDHIIAEGDTVSLQLYRFPYAEPLSQDDISITFESYMQNCSYHWDNNILTVNCEEGSQCVITISDGVAVTTFTVSNPSALMCTYLTALRSIEKATVEIRYLIFGLYQVLDRIL